ncbi:MAG: alanine racemase [Gammaproteobacteria bacterium]|nr:alanine racemase [Gammaproteobacteria bacterium]
MSRATRAVIDLAALRHNLQISRQAAPNSKQMAIIKAHAYGHGMVRIAQALDEADAFGVAIIEEAIPLREAGISKPILLLEGFNSKQDLNLIRGYKLDCVIHHESQLKILESIEGDPIKVWLKIDSGMHRLGFSPDIANEVYQRLLKCPSVSQPISLMTHLSNADDLADDFTEQQIRTFNEAIGFKNSSNEEIDCSIANSAGIMGWPSSHADWVRPGIMLYGVSPFISQATKQYDLKPVMTLKSELIAVNQYKKGDRIGYGGTWACPEDMPVGVVAIGYGDGYPRHAPSGTPVLVKDRPCQLVGRVSMDMLTIDLRHCSDAKPGDEVILWGKGLPIEKIADLSGTIAYELLCGVTNRVAFEYQDK